MHFLDKLPCSEVKQGENTNDLTSEPKVKAVTFGGSFDNNNAMIDTTISKEMHRKFHSLGD